MELLEDIIGGVARYSTVVIVILGCLLHFTKRLDAKYAPLIWLALASLFCEFLGDYLRVEFKNNMPAFHLYGLLHGICLVWFFSANISKGKLVLWIGGVYLILYILNSLFLESIFTYNATAKVTQNVFFVILSFWYFFDLYRLETSIELESSGIFWIVFGILIYHSGAFFSSLFSAKILSLADGSLFSTWILHNFSTLLKNILVIFGLWMGRTRLQMN